jgi:tetratricopeptide (TPR) repeat protein
MKLILPVIFCVGSSALVPQRLGGRTFHSVVRLQMAPDSESPITPIPHGEKQNVLREHPQDAPASALLASDVTDYGIRTALAEEHIALGNYEEALKLAKEAVDLAEHVREPDNIYTAYAEGIWADALFAMGSYKESANRYKEALRLYERHYRSSGSPEAVELVGATQLVAWNFLSQREFEEAQQSWSLALGLTEHLMG